ncbi:MAG: GNAT family N-acetyltransferase [Patescibacteria group bacterium]
MKIEELKNVTTKVLDEINLLIPQLSSSAKLLTYARLLDMVKNERTTTLVIKDGQKIIGMGMVVIYDVPTEKRAWLEEIMVDEAYRGQGLGERLSKELIEIARHQRVNRVYLSSGLHREAANKLYQKLGFEKKETNVYKLKLD